jgi:hypothetical protein
MVSWLELYAQLIAGKVIMNKGSRLLFCIKNNRVVLKEVGDRGWILVGAEAIMLRDLPEMYELYNEPEWWMLLKTTGPVLCWVDEAVVFISARGVSDGYFYSIDGVHYSEAYPLTDNDLASFGLRRI